MLWIGAAALFGLQLVIVFAPRFGDGLDRIEQQVHLLATGLTALAIGVLLTPITYIRATDASPSALEFARISVRPLRVGMGLLGAGTVLDFFLVACVILRNQYAFVAAFALLIVYVVLWYIVPRAK